MSSVLKGAIKIINSHIERLVSATSVTCTFAFLPSRDETKMLQLCSLTTTVCVPHPCLHCGLLDNVLQPLLMVSGGLGPRTFLFLLPFLRHKGIQDTICGTQGRLWGRQDQRCCEAGASPPQGSAAASVARLSSSSPAPSPCWSSVWPGRSADGAAAGLDTWQPPQPAWKRVGTQTDLQKHTTKSFGPVMSEHRGGGWNTKEAQASSCFWCLMFCDTKPQIYFAPLKP